MPETGETVSGPVEFANSSVTTEAIVEAVLFATDAPLSGEKIAGILGVGDARDVKRCVEALNERYAGNGASFRIEYVAKGYRMMTLPVFDRWIGQLLEVRRESRLTGAALETLAVVGYKQPVLRAEIEAIRGVACGETLNRLRELNLIRIVGRAEELGRPMLYGTTIHFLEVFGLGSLDELPAIEEILPRPKESNTELRESGTGTAAVAADGPATHNDPTTGGHE